MESDQAVLYGFDINKAGLTAKPKQSQFAPRKALRLGMKIIDGAENAPRFRSWIVAVIADYEVDVRPIKSAVAVRGEANFQAVGQRGRDSHLFPDQRKRIAKSGLEPLLQRPEIAAGKRDAHLSVEEALIAVADCRWLELVSMQQDVIEKIFQFRLR